MTLDDFDLLIHLLCSQIIEAAILTTLLRPNFEEPLDTPQQLVEKNITLFNFPTGQIFKQFLQNSNLPGYKILGDNMIVTKDWPQVVLQLQ